MSGLEHIQDFLKPSHNYGTRQGYFHPVNESKYIGDVRKIIYRSGWEFEFLKKFCDENPAVVRYSSENICVGYRSPFDGSKHRYFIDFYLEINMGDEIIKWLVEMKPEKYTLLPKLPKTQTEDKMRNYWKTYNTTLINIEKFKAAKRYADSVGAIFVVVSKDKKTGNFRYVKWDESKIRVNPVRD